MASKMLRIGELSTQTGCPVETIRYYERLGLLPKPPRQANGYRIYGEAYRARLIFIRRARELSFSLEEIRDLLGLLDAGRYSCAEVQTLALRHRQGIRQKIIDLRRLDAVLTELADQCSGGAAPPCPIVDALSDASR